MGEELFLERAGGKYPAGHLLALPGEAGRLHTIRLELGCLLTILGSTQNVVLLGGTENATLVMARIIVESKNHGMVWKGSLRSSTPNPPAVGKDTSL